MIDKMFNNTVQSMRLLGVGDEKARENEGLNRTEVFPNVFRSFFFFLWEDRLTTSWCLPIFQCLIRRHPRSSEPFNGFPWKSVRISYH